jgi:tetratricopeptide (TPR) repeat protein
MFEKSLQILLKVAPSNHPGIAAAYHNSSQVYDTLGITNKAIEYLEKALQIELHSLPPNHPTSAATYLNLAVVLSKQWKLKEALPYMKKAYEVSSKYLSSNDPQLIEYLQGIAMIEQMLRRLPD